MCSVFALAFTSLAHAGPIGGTYASPLGTLTLEEQAGVVRGKTVGKSPCGFPAGTVVLEGSRLDDSITGTVKACKTGPKCTGSVEGIVMLLVTRNGDVLSGAAHVDAGKCKTPVGAEGLSIRRQVAKGSTTAAPGDAPTTGEPSRDTAKEAEQKGGANIAPSTSDKPRKDPPKGDDGKRPTGEKPKTGDASSPSSSKDPRHGSTTAEAASPTTAPADETVHKPIAAGTPTTDAAPAARRGDRKAAEKLAIDGVTLMQTGKIEEARALFEQATEIDPSYGEGWTLVGVTFYQRDRYDEALDMYKRALEVNPGHHDAYYNIACIYARTGEKEKAFSYLQIALLNGYVDVNTISDDPDLKSLEGDERFTKLKAGDFFY